MEKIDDRETLSIMFTLEYVTKLKEEGITSTEFIQRTPCSICGKKSRNLAFYRC